jgi:UDP-N-acetylglucosamine diphosphorylase/glucosamine-1-phosphate N-acetyltransferase
MAKKGIILKEYESVEKLNPITLTRAAFCINVGGYTLYEMIKEYFPGIKIGFDVRKDIDAITNAKYKNEKMPDSIIIDACSVPSLSNMKKIVSIMEGKKELFDLITYPHQIIVWHKRICKENMEFMAEKRKYERPEDGVCIGKNVLVHESAVLNAEKGPIIIDDNSLVMPFSYIEGPVYIGKNTRIADHSSIKDNVVILDTCKIGGEVESSIVMSYSNKQHYGFLGNSVVGEWVNIGAGTTTSDLKNTYGEIHVTDGTGNIINTKEQFLGSVIGDYSKFTINTSIFTGKVIGMNSMIYGIVDKDIPSFVNLTVSIKGINEEFQLQKAIETQKRMFERRNIEQKKEDVDILTDVFIRTEEGRKNFLASKI